MSDEKKNAMIILPRRFCKTLLATIFITWYCLKYPDRNVLLVTDVLHKAKGIIKSVKSIISSNEYIKTVFGNKLITKDGNNSTRMTLSTRKSNKKEPNLLAYSMLQTPQSLRADLVIFEDVISHKYKTSRQIKAKTDENFEAIIPILEKSAKVVYIGTRFHYDDLPAKIKEQNKEMNNWNIIEESAEDKMGKARFPHIINDSELMELRNRLSLSFYSSQYLNKPMSKEESLFNLETYDYYKDKPDRNELKSVIIGVDLAFSTKDNADTRAIAVIGVDRKGHIYLLDAYESREELDQFYESLKNIYLKWTADRVYVETNSAFKMIYESFIKRSMSENIYIPFSEVINTKNKALRLEVTLTPLLKTGCLKLPNRELCRTNNALHSLINTEMAYFNSTSGNNKDDLLDALEIACSKVKENLSTDKNKVGGKLRTSSLKDWY